MARWLLPEGISDVLPHEAAHVERLRRSVLDLLHSHGYLLVYPPLVEYLDSLLTGTGRDLDLRTFKLVDQLSGRQLGVRADITPQIARIDAHILNRAGVVRLCYAGSVLHTRPQHPLASREPFQVGAELYGYAGVAADREVHALAVRTLRLAGVGRVTLDVGHTGIVRSLLAADPAALAAAEEILAALGSKDGAALRGASAGLAESTRRGLAELTELSGGAEVLARARKRLPAVDGVRRALDELEGVLHDCPADGVSVDLADLHGYRYYSGVNFAAYDTAAQIAVARGGRYDDIGRAFGRARPASGFSVDLRELTRRNGEPASNAILAPAGADEELAATVATLRAAGDVVVQQLGPDDVVAGLEITRILRRVDGRWKVLPRTPS